MLYKNTDTAYSNLLKKNSEESYNWSSQSVQYHKFIKTPEISLLNDFARYNVSTRHSVKSS